MPTSNRSGNQQQTTTQIRTIFSDSAYMNLKFYNQLLSISLCRRVGTDQNGKPLWDNGTVTTINYENAVQFIEACKIFLKDPWKPVEVSAQVLRNESTLALSAVDTKSPAGFIVSLSLTKGNDTIIFQFKSDVIKARNEATGQMVDVQIQTQLYSFLHVLESYVAGINSDRHLDKMTSDYAQAQGGNNQQQNNNQNQGYQRNNNGWNGNRNNNGGNNRRWNNNGGGNRNYNNNGGYRN